MYDVIYNVMFAGDLLPDHDRETVHGNIASLFGVNKMSVKILLSGKEHKVKSNLDLVSARKYVRALARLGALGYIEQRVVEHSEPLASAPARDRRFTTTGDFDLEAVQQYFAEQEARKKAQLEKTAEHALYSLDDLDDVSQESETDNEPTGVHNVLNAEEVARMLNSK
jgi:hypothetical protein